MLGQAGTTEEARRLAAAYANPARARSTLEEVQALWDGVLGAVRVRTPDPAFDLMLNRWLLYQALACRMWGRSAYYQSSGAFGFRDQLQDSMALGLRRAARSQRAQILRAATRQFEEGDVQHWWHPPGRTRSSHSHHGRPYTSCHS